MSAKAHVVSAFSLFGQSYEIVKRNLRNFAILMILPFMASVSASSRYKTSVKGTDRLAHINFFNTTAPAYAIFGLVGISIFLFFVIAVFVTLVIQAMLFGLQLEGAQGKTPSLKHLWTIGKKYWFKLLGLSLMIGLYIVGLALFGIIFILIFRNVFGVILGSVWMIGALVFVVQRYFLSPYVLIDNDLPILDAMEKSAGLAKDHAGAIWSVIGVSILLGFAGIVPILGPIIAFALGAIYSVAPALRYEELKKLR